MSSRQLRLLSFGDSTRSVVTSLSKPRPYDVSKNGPLYVYLLKCGDYIKVGVAKDVRVRLSAIRSGNPYPVELVECVRLNKDDAVNVEFVVLNKLSAFRTSGEWCKCKRSVALHALNQAVKNIEVLTSEVAQTNPRGLGVPKRVKTPHGAFPSISAAADSAGISAASARMRALRGLMGWSFE